MIDHTLRPKPCKMWITTLYNMRAAPCRLCSTVGFQYRGGIMINVGDILSTVEGVQYHGGVQYLGGHHEYHGSYLEYRGVISWCTWGGDIMSTVGDKIFCYLSTPTVLNTLHGTHDIPHIYHDIPTVLHIKVCTVWRPILFQRLQISI